MRIVRTAASDGWSLRQPSARAQRGARLERFALAAITPVLLLGLWLTYSGQSEELGDVGAGVESGAIVDLREVKRPVDLQPVLRRAADGSLSPADRDRLAKAIAGRVSGTADQAAESIAHIGALASVITPAEVTAVKPFLVVRRAAEFRRALTIALIVFFAAFWIAHAVRARLGLTGDVVLLPAVLLLTGLSLMTMLALRDPVRDTMAAVTMAYGAAAGCVVWVALAFVDFERVRLRRAVLPPLAGAVLLAVALLLFGSGPVGSGAKVNLFGAQPVEVIRLLTVFALAAYFARRWQFLRAFSQPVSDAPAWRALRLPRWRGWRALRLPRWKDVQPLVVSISALLLLFFLQKDLGPALVLSCVVLGLYGLSRGHAALVACGFAVLGTGFATGYFFGMPATVTRRVAIALDPWSNALPGGDQIAHALWAMASGGALGLGPGVGDPQIIPAGHTDLVIAALGEELGVIGPLVVLALFVILTWRMMRIALRAPGDYTALLVVGLTLAIVVQAVVITAGMLGLLPLTGVATPFLSYGRSAMLINFAAVAICAAVSRHGGAPRLHFASPMRVLTRTLAVAAAVLAVRLIDVQIVRADSVAIRPALTVQADAGLRYFYNPRFIAAARSIVRGTVYDRSGLPLATSRPETLAPFIQRFRQIGVTVPANCTTRTRCYPLGGLAFHLLGEASQQINWAASNTSYIEKDFDAHLKGFADHVGPAEVVHPRTGRPAIVVQRDYRELLPLVRHKGHPTHRAVREIRQRDRDLRLTVDAGLQVRTASAVRTQVERAGSLHGAAVVLEPTSGSLLSVVSYPWPDERQLRGETTAPPDTLLDRARYGLYPPGSTFKLVTAVAALRAQPATQHSTFQCVRLADGRVGGQVRGAARPIRDDPLDHQPHGAVDLHKGLVASCNVYFSHLAMRLGAEALGETAAVAQIAAAPAPMLEHLRRTLPYAGYGQGDVLASPLRMARVSGALAAGGLLRAPRVNAAAGESEAVRWVSADGAARLRLYMREAITSGTGRALAQHAVAIAGKTGTAEVDDRRSHSWFVGFAPYSGQKRIAFAVIVENAGYGGRFAAPLAGEIVSAAQARGLLQ